MFILQTLAAGKLGLTVYPRQGKPTQYATVAKEEQDDGTGLVRKRPPTEAASFAA
jgi:hypothetical protein